MVQNIIIALTFTTIFISFISGTRLVTYKGIRNSTYTKYKIVCYILAAACFCLGIFNIIHIVKNGFVYIQLPSCSIISLTISASQSFLFTAALIPLYTNKKILFRKYALHSIPMIFFPIAYFISIQFEENLHTSSINDIIYAIQIKNIPSIIRAAFCVTYFLQMGIFTRLFFKVRKEYLCYAETVAQTTSKSIRLEWVKYAFLSALLEGILAIVFVTTPTLVTETIFRAITSLFYLVFPIYYIDYSNTYNSIKEMLQNTVKDENGENIDLKESSSLNFSGDNSGIDQMLSNVIVRNNELFRKAQIYIVEEKHYTNPDLKIETILTELGTNRIYLTNAIKQNTNQTISEFILTCRIDYAKELLRDSHSQQKIEEIAQSSGFNSLRTFYRNFKSKTGVTPEEYRKNNN